jgi:hypothetical protein
VVAVYGGIPSQVLVVLKLILVKVYIASDLNYIHVSYVWLSILMVMLIQMGSSRVFSF